MPIGEILSALGVSGSIATIIMAAVGLKHGREILGWLSVLSLATKIAGGLLFLFIVLSSGLVPGLQISIDANFAVLGRLVADLFDLTANLLRTVIP